MTRFGRWTLPALAAGVLSVAHTAMAQTEAGDDAWRRRFEELDRKVKVLEEKLERAERRAAGAEPAEPVAVPAPAAAAPDPSLQQRVDELEQQARITARKVEIDQEAAAQRAKDGPQAIAGRDGFGLRTADNQFVLRLRGLIQVDARAYDSEVPGTAPDTFTLRRIRPTLEGTLFGKYGYRFTPDFGQGTTQIFDAYGDANFHPAFKLRVGKFKPPVGLERLQSATALGFVERSFPTNLVPTRDIGVQVAGEFFDTRLGYEVGAFNGVVDGGQGAGGSGDRDSNNGKDVAVRLFAHPFRNTDFYALSGLGIGVAATWGNQNGSATTSVLPTYLTPGQQTFFSYNAGAHADGERTRLAPQFYWYWQQLGVLGEYNVNSQQVRRAGNLQDVETAAWQLALSWVVTGEDASFRGVTPRTNLDTANGSWGAFEVVGRVGGQTVDDAAFTGSAATALASLTTSSRKAQGYGLGLNWYWNRYVKVQFSYDQTSFERGAANGADRPDERVFFTRYQVAF